MIAYLPKYARVTIISESHETPNINIIEGINVMWALAQTSS